MKTAEKQSEPRAVYTEMYKRLFLIISTEVVGMAKKNPIADKAAELFRSGMSMADIARNLDIPDSTVRRWKNTYKWEAIKPNGGRKKCERSDKINRAKASKKEGTKQTMENEELSEKERFNSLKYNN